MTASTLSSHQAVPVGLAPALKRLLTRTVDRQRGPVRAAAHHETQATMSTPTRRHSAPPTTHALDVHGISKANDGTTVVDDVSFSVEEGEIFAILGPNGAGKVAVRITDAA